VRIEQGASRAQSAVDHDDGGRTETVLRLLSLSEMRCLTCGAGGYAADGAKWIWEEQLNHLRGAAGVLDIFHALEHVAETARCLLGDGTDEAAQWLDAGRTKLLNEGYRGIEGQIRETRRRVRSPKKRRSLDELFGY